MHTNHFSTLYEKKLVIEGNILQLLTVYDKEVDLERAIDEAKEAVNTAVRSKNLNKEFRVTKKFKYWTLEKTSYHNLIHQLPSQLSLRMYLCT